MNRSFQSRVLLLAAAALLLSAGRAGAQSTSSSPIIPPNYSTFTPPARGGSYTDPAFGTTIRRLSDAKSEGTTYVIHEYSTRSPFNANSTLVLLERGGGVMHIRDLSGNIVRDNLQTVGILPGSDPAWSRTDANVIYFHTNGGNQIMSYNQSTNLVTTLMTIAGSTSVTFGAGKGDVSWDGNRIPIIADCKLGMSYIISTNSLSPSIDLSPYMLTPCHDNADLAPATNDYVFQAATLSSGTLYAFDPSMNFLRTVLSFQGHGDMGKDLDGSDIIVLTNSNAPAGTTVASCPNSPVKARISDGAQTCLQPLDWSLAVHISCNDVGQSWCSVSSYSSDSPSTLWPAYANEVLQVKLDGSGSVRLAHTRSTNSTYASQPRAAVSPDGQYILFDSDMQGAHPDVYLLFVPGAAAATKTNTSSTLTSGLNPSSSGQPVTFTAKVSPSTATGTVTFLDGTTTVGSGTLSGGAANFTTSTLAAGSHSITARYGGDSSYNGSTSAAVSETVTSTAPPSSGVIRFEQTDPSITYTGPWAGVWFTVTNSASSGGSYITAMDAGSQATFTFTGTGVTWIGYRDQWSGIAQVSLDGVSQGSLDLYSPSAQTQSVNFSKSGLAAGSHTLVISVTGTHSVAAAGSWVGIDAFDVTSGGTTTTTTSSPPVISGVTSSASRRAATIAWTTDVAATSTVEYGTTTAYGATAPDSTMVTSHSMSLSNLNSGTLYHYRVRSTNAAGKEAISGDFTFTTTRNH